MDSSELIVFHYKYQTEFFKRNKYNTETSD